MMTGVSTPDPISKDKVFPTIRSKKDPAHTMHAVEWYGSRKVRVVETPRPLVTEPKDAIIRTTASTICGSDLHLYNNEFAGMEKGDIIGHEAIGIVEDVGPEVSKFKRGDRVVISAVIACGHCFYCDKGLFSNCDNTNPSTEMEQQYGHRTAALFGYSHLTGGWDGCQAEYVRVPFADVNLLRLPENLPDEKALVLADIACTGWHATELGNVSQGDVVGVWGCGPVGLMAQAWSKFRKASRVIAIDCDPYRLSVAKEQLGCEIINFAEENVTRRLQELVPRGLDVAIEAAGFRFSKGILHAVQRKLKLETDTPQMLNECIMAVRKGGIISVVGDYFQACNGFMIGAFMEKGLCMRGGQVYIQRYWEQLLGYIQDGSFDPSWIFTHHMSLDDAAEAYRIFDKHEQNVLKILLRPHTDVNMGGTVASSSSSASSSGVIGSQNPI